MSNHLIPEKRLDKNGRLNIKHVRAAAPAKEVSAPPAPTLPSAPKRDLDKRQRRPMTRKVEVLSMYGLGDPGDEALCAHLGVEPDAPSTLIHASDEEIYDLFSVTSNGNAHALLRTGIRTADEAASYLEEHGFDHLLEDRSTLCNEALNRRIAPQDFIHAEQRLPPADGSPHFMDAIEIYSSDYIREDYSLTLGTLVYNGTIRNEDAKRVGYKHIGQSRETTPVIDALVRLAGDDSPLYTADDIRALLDKYPADFWQAIKLSERYGADLALSIKNINLGYAKYLEENDTPRERAVALIRYRDQIDDYELEYQMYGQPLPHRKIEKYYDSGVAISMAANDECTEQQLDAIISGKEPGFSGGWL